MMENKVLTPDYMGKYRILGRERFFNFIVVFGIDKLAKLKNKEYDGVLPHIEFMDHYENILTAYRRGAGEEYLELAKTFRKAAHKIYRVGLQQKIIRKSNKFLQTAGK